MFTTLATVSRADFSNYANGLSRMVQELNSRADSVVAQKNAAGPMQVQAKTLVQEISPQTPGLFEQITVGLEQAAASPSRAAAAYSAQI